MACVFHFKRNLLAKGDSKQHFPGRNRSILSTEKVRPGNFGNHSRTSTKLDGRLRSALCLSLEQLLSRVPVDP